MSLSFVRSSLVRQLILFVVCLAFCVAVRAVVRTSLLSDTGDLFLEVFGAMALLAALAVALRSARRAPSLPARIALRAFPVALALLGAVFVRGSYPDISCDLQTLMEAHGPRDARTAIALGPTGRDVRLSGTIEEGAANRLEALLDAHPDVERIHLTSEGGLADEGRAIGEVIAAHGLTTYVPDFCVSACTLAFVRGRQRYVLRSARIGFHAPYTEGLFGQQFQDDSSVERLAYVSAGVAPAFADKALAVASSDMWFPDPERLVAEHVATGIVDKYRFPDSNLDGEATLAGAKAELLRNFPILAPVAMRLPETFDTVASSYFASYQRGLSEGQAVGRLEVRMRSIMAGLMVETDDASLRAATGYLARALAVASPLECVEIGATHDLVRASLVLRRSDKRAEAEAGFLVASAIIGTKQTTHAAASSAEGFPMPPATNCDDYRQAYARTLALPPAQGAALARARFQLWRSAEYETPRSRIAGR